MSTMLVNAGLTTFQKIEETNPRQIELVMITNKNRYERHNLLWKTQVKAQPLLAFSCFILPYYQLLSTLFSKEIIIG